MNSHAQMPVAHIRDDCFRVFFSTRPHPGCSLPAFIDIDLRDPTRIRNTCPQPLLQLGPPGAFDEHGIMPTMVIDDGNELRLYYTGWSRLAGRAPYNNSSGVAVSRDRGETFARLFPGPVLSRTEAEPLSSTLSWIVRDGTNGWHMWYSTGTEWLLEGDRAEPVYLICQAWSRDGVRWERNGKPIIPTVRALEAQSRPTVLCRNGMWHMWFCHRSGLDFRDGAGAYRMGYACSNDLHKWERDDARAGIEASESGWDSEMLAYPCVLETPAGVLMFYNGNGFGASGMGWAKLEE